MSANAMDDQFAAAVRETRQRVAEMARHGGGVLGQTTELGPIADRVLAATRAAAEAGTAQDCVHLADGGPQPMFMAAVRPELTTCVACSPLVAGYAEEASGVCYECGEASGGRMLLCAGAITIFVSLCRPCGEAVVGGAA